MNQTTSATYSEDFDFHTEFKNLYQMQDELNKVMEKPPRRQASLEEVKIALLVEIGETLQECKKIWGWWKLTQKDVDKDKLKEELADVLHFALMYELYMGNQYMDPDDEEFLQRMIGGYHFPDNVTTESDDIYCDVRDLLDTPAKVLYTFELAMDLGVSPYDLILAYKRKNAINYNRVAEGY